MKDKAPQTYFAPRTRILLLTLRPELAKAFTRDVRLSVGRAPLCSICPLSKLPRPLSDDCVMKDHYCSGAAKINIDARPEEE